MSSYELTIEFYSAWLRLGILTKMKSNLIILMHFNNKNSTKQRVIF